jgi:hypothetical protein
MLPMQKISCPLGKFRIFRSHKMIEMGAYRQLLLDMQLNGLSMLLYEVSA